MKWHGFEVGDFATWLASVVAVLTFVILFWSNARERRRAERAEAAAVKTQTQINEALIYIGDSIRHQQEVGQRREQGEGEPSAEHRSVEIRDRITAVDSLDASLQSSDLGEEDRLSETRDGTNGDLAALRSILTSAPVPLPLDAQVERVINGFARAGSVEARTVAGRLAASGWQASSPPKGRYVRWVYSGSAGTTVSLYQNVGDLAVNRREQMDLVQHLPGAELATSGRATRFSYAGGIDDALAAADQLRQLTDENSPSAL